jgi:hypothetical protein
MILENNLLKTRILEKEALMEQLEEGLVQREKEMMARVERMVRALEAAAFEFKSQLSPVSDVFHNK